MKAQKSDRKALGSIISRFGLWFDDRKIAIGILIFFVITIIPMLAVAKYSHASADDFWCGAGMRRQIWSETHSIMQFLKASVQDTVSMYYGWQGTFTTTFVQMFQPEIFNVHAYFIVPYIMLPFFLGGTSFLLYYLLVKMLKMKKSVFLAVDMLYFLVAIQYIPSTGEAFYWYNGSVAYTLVYSVMLFCIGFSLRFIFDGKKRNLVMAVLTAFFVGGGNYLTIILLPLLLISMLFFLTPLKKKTLYLIIPLTVFGITAIINMTAPGTRVREGSGFEFDIRNILDTIGRAVYQGLKDVRSEYLGNPVVVISMIIIALFLASEMVGKQYKFSFPYPALFVIMTFGSYLAMYTPTYYAGVGKPFGRMSNLISFYFELSIIMDIIYVMGYIMKKWNDKWRTRGEWLVQKWKSYKIYVLFASIILIMANPQWHEKTAMVRTVNYLVSGQAKEFGDAMDRRYEMLLDKSLKDVELEEMPSAGPLFNYDITEDWNGWPNIAVADFFSKDRVMLKKVQ